MKLRKKNEKNNTKIKNEELSNVFKKKVKKILEIKNYSEWLCLQLFLYSILPLGEVAKILGIRKVMT